MDELGSDQDHKFLFAVRRFIHARQAIDDRDIREERHVDSVGAEVVLYHAGDRQRLAVTQFDGGRESTVRDAWNGGIADVGARRGVAVADLTVDVQTDAVFVGDIWGDVEL